MSPAPITARDLEHRIVSDLARGYRTAAAVAKRHGVSVEVVREMLRTHGPDCEALASAAERLAPDPAVGGGTPVAAPAGAAVEPGAVEASPSPSTADRQAGRLAGLDALHTDLTYALDYLPAEAIGLLAARERLRAAVARHRIQQLAAALEQPARPSAGVKGVS